MTNAIRFRCNECASSLALMLLLAVRNTSEAATRVALVSGDRGDAITNVVALAQAKLSRAEDLELLERDEIRRVLDEQKLTQSGIVDATQVVALGKLLKADLFAVVDGSAGSDGIASVVVFDARSGLRYWDVACSVAAAELEQASDAVAEAVKSASHKRGRQNKGLHTVGFVTVRNADLPRSQDALCDTVGFLIERGLPRSPDIAVLERRRLQRVNEERSLPGSGESIELLASLSTVDLEISRGADGRGLQATALVKHAGQQTPERVTATVAESDAAALAEALSQKLIELMHAAPVGAVPDRRVEAKRFDSEAAHHYSHKRFADTVSAQDAAKALDPASEGYSERLSLYLLRYATYLFSPTELTMTKGGDRAWMDTRIEPAVLETLLAAGQRSVEINQQLTRSSGNRPLYNGSLGMLCDRLRGLRKVSVPPAQTTIDDFLHVCQRRSLGYCESWAGRAQADPQWLDVYTQSIELENRVIKSASIDTAEYADCLFQLASRWLDVTKDWQPKFNKSDGGELLSTLLQNLIVPVSWPWPADAREFAKKMAPLYAAMQQHARPIVRLHGLLGEIRSEVLLEKETEESGQVRFATEYRQQVHSIIASPEPWNPVATRFAAYEAWRTAIDSMPGKLGRAFKIGELMELCSFMIDRRELYYKPLQQALGELDPRMSLDLIHRTLLVVDMPEFQETASEKASLKSLLKTREQEILKAHPELAAVPAKLPWTRAAKLFDVSQFQGLNELVGCVLVHETLYGVCLKFEGDQSGLRLVRIPVSGIGAELLASVDLGLPASKIPPHLRNAVVTSIVADGEAIYVAINVAGIVVFPLRGGQPRRIDLADGVPSVKTSSLAVLDRKLYAGFADGYLIAYDLQTNRCDVLASSRRKQKLSPFDDSPVFRVPTLIADQARQRVVMVIGKHLWQFTPSDGKFVQVLDLVAASKGPWNPKLDSSTIIWSGPLRGDRMLVSNVFHVMEIELAHDKASEIHAPEFGAFPIHPPQLLVDGYLWSGGSFARLSLDKREHQSLPAPDKGPTPFRASVFLESTADGRQLIAADMRSVWLLDLERLKEPVNTSPKK